MRAFTLDQIDQIDAIQACLSVIADLAEPSTDLHNVDRGDLAVLIGYFTKELKKITSQDVALKDIDQTSLKFQTVTS